MSFELIPDVGADPRNARTLSRACELAYLPAAEGAAAFKEQLGFDAELTSVCSTQVYLAQSAEHVVVAFRGSESPTSIDGLKDWLLTNAVNLLVLPSGAIGTDFAAAGVGAKFHLGFMTALADVWPTLFPKIEAATQQGDRCLWVTGHSLGGALALLAAWRLQRQFIDVHRVYTFGAPMVGNAVAAEAFQREFAGRIFRYVNFEDLVPRLPTVSLLSNDYAHCNQEMGVGPGGPESLAGALASLAAEAIDGLFNHNLMDKLWAQVQTRLTAHDIANYRNVIS
ncbi:MAG TPA: lipase family protein [Gemmatales bacterium]|nr:lipase family protein [Gemmatales bacterium]HMP57816.1 lipase family protein [Gemmatales bacterium]